MKPSPFLTIHSIIILIVSSNLYGSHQDALLDADSPPDNHSSSEQQATESVERVACTHLTPVTYLCTTFHLLPGQMSANKHQKEDKLMLLTAFITIYQIKEHKSELLGFVPTLGEVSGFPATLLAVLLLAACFLQANKHEDDFHT